jgi:hypothetical protein
LTPEKLGHETDDAVEQLLLRRNGQKKTVQDVFEVVVAMNHDRRSDTVRLLGEIRANREMVQKHLTEDARMTNVEFAELISGFNQKHLDRDVLVAELDRELDGIKENCAKLHTRAPRRRDDPDTEDWGRSYGDDEEMGDIRRLWRTARWVVIVVGGTMLVAVGDQLSHRLFGS